MKKIWIIWNLCMEKKRRDENDLITTTSENRFLYFYKMSL
jgi:hypothetical protein